MGGLTNPVHLAFIAMIALLFLGPKKLPEIARSIGSGMREFRETLSGDGSRHEEPAVEPTAALTAASPVTDPAAPAPAGSPVAPPGSVPASPAASAPAAPAAPAPAEAPSAAPPSA
ncbi:MAG TPA: twin-arginine translocase TatA/TatE family subunit [Solirubrobacteraceae bacterium]|jgi:sec-independent protein translocase protein TatA|nr:twin-arginine translocase TatA/TatE family subunit [Solirubrobacteraceae bacterium]